MPSCVRRMLGYVVTVWLLLLIYYTGEARSTAVVATGREVPNGRTAEEVAPALDTTRTIFDFSQGDSVPSAFVLAGEVSTGADEGARLVIRHGGDVPSLALPGHFRYGRAEVFVKGIVAAGAVTALRLRSGSDDEIALVSSAAYLDLVAWFYSVGLHRLTLYLHRNFWVEKSSSWQAAHIARLDMRLTRRISTPRK